MCYYVNSSEETDSKDVRLSNCLDPTDQLDDKENEPNPQSDHKQRYSIMYYTIVSF